MSSVLANLNDKDLFIGADHAGFALKSEFLNRHPELSWTDLGTNSEESVDYPDYADRVVKSILKNGVEKSIGVLICGTGQGMAIRANRTPSIRAALCWSEEIAKMARSHNDANVLCLPNRFVSTELAEKILTTFLTTPFEGGRHERRVKKLGC